MALVKAVEFSKESTKKEIFNLNDIAVEAESIIAAAREESTRILAQARQEANHLREQARVEGQREGQQAGREEGQKAGQVEALQLAQADFKQRTEQTLRLLTDMLSQFDTSKHELLWRAEQETVALAVTVARKVIKRVGWLRSEVAGENLRAALDMVAKRTDMTIHVHSRDLEHLQQMVQADNALGDYRSIRFKANDAIEPGGCRLETDLGAVDAQLDTQLRRIAEELILTDDLRKKVCNDVAATEPLSPVDTKEEE